MNPSLLDTDILTEIFKRRNRTLAAHAAAYLREHGQFAISAMTRFEVVRGLRHKRSAELLQRFELMCDRMLILPISDGVLDRAADLWAKAHSGGHPLRDADLLIASTALVHSRDLITGNTPHFQWIEGLRIANWRMP